MDRGAWLATVHRMAESDTAEVTGHTCVHDAIFIITKEKLS